MENKENKLFREEALERLSSPEQLDQMMQVVNRRAWLPLTTIGSLIVVAVIWSVFGRIPLAVNGQGVLMRGSVAPFQVSTEGQIKTLTLKYGDKIKKGEVVGEIDQPQLRQQLQQEKSKLAELVNQNKQTDELQRQGIALKRQNLQKQQEVLKVNLATVSKFGPILREKSIEPLKLRRKSLQQSLAYSKSQIPTYKRRLEVRRDLKQTGAVSEDMVLQSQQEYAENLTKVSDLEAQLKELDRQQTEAEAQYVSNSKDIKDINAQIQNLDVQAAQLNQQDREQSIEKNNKIQTTKRQISQLELELATKSRIISKYNGRVLAVAIAPGQTVSAGARIASIEIEDPNAQLMSVIYLANKDGKQIKPGMSVQVTPSPVKRERFGGIVGKVTQVDSSPVTKQDISKTIGNEDLAGDITQSFSTSGGAPIQILAQLEQDPETGRYKWSSSKGPELEITSGTKVEVRVQVDEKAPISYVIPLFKSLTGLH